MQQMWQQAAVVGMLAICSAEDIRKKKVCINLVFAFGIIGIFFHMIWQQYTIQNLLAGMAVGVLLLIFSVISGGKVGTGDGIILIVTGVYLGAKQNIELFFTGLLLCGIWAVYLLVFQKRSREEEIPFVPFLLAAYMGMLVISI